MESLDSNGIERVFLRLLNCDTDEGLQELLKRFIVPLLAAFQSDNTLVPKLNELLGHLNKRLLNRPDVQFPFYSLVELVKRDDLASFTMNMGVLYVKKAYERMPLNDRLANVELIFSCLANTTEFQSDVLLSVLLPTLKVLRIPNYLDKQEKLLPSVKNTVIAKKIYNFSLKVILMPYLALTDKSCWKEQPALSEAKISGILKHVPDLSCEALEGAKCSLINVVGSELFNFAPPLVAGLMVVGQGDPRCSVSDAAESRLKKLRNSVDWEDDSVVVLLYGLCLGHDKLPAKIRHLSHGSKAGSLRLRMKLLPVLSLSKNAANLFPLNVQVVFGGLFGVDANKQLNLSAVQFVHKICDDASDTVLNTIGAMLKQGLLKSIQSTGLTDMKLCGRLYLGLGKLSTRTPNLFSSDVYLLSLLFSMLEQEDRELITDLKEGLFLMTGAYKSVLGTQDEQTLEELLLKYINKADASPCASVALRFSNILHPTSHLPSRYLCLLALGSGNTEVVDEAKVGLKGSEDDKLPEFGAAVDYIGKCTHDRLNTPSLCYVVGAQKLPYIPSVFTEVLKFVLECLYVDLPDHVVLDCDKYKYLRNLLLSLPGAVISRYKELLMTALVPAASGILQSLAMEHLAQLSASLPETLDVTYEWCEVFLTSPQLLLRSHTAALIGLIARRGAGDVDVWAERVLKLITDKTTTFEKRDGGILAAGYISCCCSRPLAAQLITRVVAYLESEHVIGVFASIQNCCYSLDLTTLLGLETSQKLQQQLITMVTQAKEQKILIPLISVLGSLHVHCTDLKPDQTLNALMCTAKRNLLELNFAVGKTLAMLSSGPGSAPTIPDIFVNVVQSTSTIETTFTKEILEKVVRGYILEEVRDIELQAASVWILSLLKYSTDVANIAVYKSDIQHALSVLLSNKDILTQEIASEALSLLYSTADSSTKSHLVDMLKSTLLNETVQHKHVAMESKIFSPEDLGKLPTSMGGGNLTTYKELCSLASDMNQPEMIYQFMHLSNNSSLWSDRVGAAFGVGHLVKSAGKELEPYLSSIIPRIYRYQFDPNLKVQQSMSNIWSIIVPKPKDTVDRYLTEILADLKNNIHHKMWRTRESCSNALGDVVRVRAYHDLILSELPQLWELVLQLMDDIKESVRQSAAKTAEVLSKTSVSVCKVDDGTRGARAISTILPVLLERGITSRVVEVQTVAIVTVMKISENAGPLLSPHVDVIVPAFITASANIEPKALGHITTMVSGDEENKDKMEQARAHLAMTSPLIPVIEKCIRGMEKFQLDTLVPRLASLAKTAVGLTPRITLLHTVSLLAVYKQQDLAPLVGKLMGAMFVVLSDRSVAVRDKCGATVAVLFRYAKPGTIDNVMERLQTWYLEKEDIIRHLVSQIFYKLSNSAPDILRTVHSAAVPLTLYGRHSGEDIEKGEWEKVWLELGISDQSATLTHLPEISALCTATLQSTSWNNRIQAAKTLTTVAKYLNTSYPTEQFTSNVAVLIEVSAGRTFPGKSAIISALSCTLTSTQELRGLDEGKVLEVFFRECRRKDEEYASAVMRSFGDLILGVKLDSDCWEEIWELCSAHLIPQQQEDAEEEAKEKKKKTETFTIESAVQESAILLIGVAWKVCQSKSYKIVELAQFLSSIMRLCSWNLQLVLLCAIQRVLESPDLAQGTRSSVYESFVPSVLRCVDDTKHSTVRSMALGIISYILKKYKEFELNVNRSIFEEVLIHVRDQISNESNQNIKSRGIEIVTMVEKEFNV